LQNQITNAINGDLNTANLTARMD